MKAQNADQDIEKLAHTMAICTRLHDAAVLDALLPLVKKLEKGGTLAQSMSDKVGPSGGQAWSGVGHTVW